MPHPQPIPRRRSRAGMTLLEVLVAVSIFGFVVAAVTGGVASALSAQSVNEASSSAQVKLRRVTEVLTQELRSAVLGGVSNTPVASDAGAISFTLLQGGAGYQVLPHDSGNNTSFRVSTNLEILAPVDRASDLGLVGQQALVVNGNGDATMFDVTNATRNGGGGSAEFRLNHPACANTVDYTPNSTLLFGVRSVGFQYDPATRILYEVDGAGDRIPFAFDLDTFRIEYIYEDDAGALTVRTAPITNASGAVVKRDTSGGTLRILRRVQVIVGTTAQAGSREVQRTYSGQVELNNNASFVINKVIPCS